MHRIENDRVHLPGGVSVLVRPFVGTIGVCPESAGCPTIRPHAHGGNMDVRDLGPGSRLYLPVALEGAMFGLGDCKVMMGEGESPGAGIDTSVATTVRFGVIEGRSVPAPMVRTETAWISLGNADTIEAAARVAYAAMLGLVQRKLCLDWLDAYCLTGLVGDLRLPQIVNPHVTAAMQVERELIDFEWAEAEVRWDAG
jgi:amidase